MYVMLTSEHCSSSPWSVLNYNSMNYERLSEAYRAATQRESEAAWVGPGPRVTRAVADPCAVRTTVAWLLRIPEVPPGMDERQWINESVRPVRERLLRTLETAQVVGGDWLRTEVTDYNPALNGPVSFWESGQAANTRTRNGVDAGSQEENRVGPDNAEQFRSRTTIGDRLSGALPWVIGVGAVAGVAVLALVGYGIYSRRRFAMLQAQGPLFPGPAPMGLPPPPPMPMQPQQIAYSPSQPFRPVAPNAPSRPPPPRVKGTRRSPS